MRSKIQILVILAFMSVGKIVGQKIDGKFYIPGTCETGILKAEEQVSNRVFTSVSYGLQIRSGEGYKFYEFYRKYMKSKYGIIFKDGGCSITDEVRCYSKRMRELTLEEFGPTIFERSKAEALALYQKKE